MGDYHDIGVCIRQALAFTCALDGCALSSAQKEALLKRYRELSPFDDVASGLEALREAGHRLFAFSNGGTERDVEHLLEGAGIRTCFAEIVSVDEVGRFKPAPGVYRYLMRRTGSPASASWHPQTPSM